MQRRALPTTSLLAVVALLAACSTAADTSSTTTTTQTSTQTTTQTSTQTSTTDGDDAGPSGSLEGYLAQVDLAWYRVTRTDDASPHGESPPVDQPLTELHVGTTPPHGTQICFAAATDVVWVDGGALCPGDWTSFRRDPWNTANAGLRFNGSVAPSELAPVDLQLSPEFDPNRFLAVASETGPSMVVNVGDHLERWDVGGRRWSSPAFGWGQLLAVDDLDGDGRDEVLFSPTTNSSSGTLAAFSFDTGELVWTLELTGIEFGFERDRITIVHDSPTGPATLLAALTYSTSIWRIDFGRGPEFGRVTWRSAPLAYDSPDKAPVLVDVDLDGEPEVVVDALSVLYTLDFRTGEMRAQIQYADPVPSFDGPLLAVAGSDTSPLIITLSDSVYSKQATAIGFQDGVPVVRWHHEWDVGLAANSYDISFAPSLVVDGNGQSVLIWSTARAGGDPHDSVIEIVDTATGSVVSSLPERRFVQVMTSSTGADLLVTQADTGLDIYRIQDGQGVLLRHYEGFTARPPTTTQAWSDGSGRTRAPTVVLVADPRGTVTASQIDGAGSLQPMLRPPSDLVAAADAVGIGIVLASSTGALLLRSTSTASATVTLTLDSQASVTPIVADLDADGQRELLVPFRSRSAVFRFTGRGDRPTRVDAYDDAIAQWREGFYVPIIGFDPVSSSRVLVGFRRQNDGVAIIGWSAAGGILWSRPMPPDVWEPSLATTPFGGSFVLQQSRAVQAIDLVDGALRWQLSLLGECKRTLSFMPFAEGNGDVVVSQAADHLLFIDPQSGRLLLDDQLPSAWGGYTAVAVSTSGQAEVLASGSGAISLVDDSGELIRDEQLDSRKMESIPPVVMADSTDPSGRTFASISGQGLVRIIGSTGAVLRSRGIGSSAATMTGALLDGDDDSDLLVSTADGQLVALSGATLAELWSVDLNSTGGPAIVTDLDADGVPEIVVVSGDGMLHRLVAATP